MTAIQEMLISILTNETFNKVHNQFINPGTSVIQIDIEGLDYRLLKPDETTINLELLNTMPIRSKIDGKIIMYYMPIGYFSLGSGNLEFTVVKYFENDINFLNDRNMLPLKMKINNLSLIENALLAAFSMEAVQIAVEYRDANLTVNGLDLDIFMTFEGYPQSYLNDKYGLLTPLAAYMTRREGKIKPNPIYNELYARLDNMKLLTAYKSLGSKEIKSENNRIENWVNKTFMGSQFNSFIYDVSENFDELKRKGLPFAMASFDINDDTSIAIGMEREDQTPRDFINENQNNKFIIDMSISPRSILKNKEKRIVYSAKKIQL